MENAHARNLLGIPQTVVLNPTVVQRAYDALHRHTHQTNAALRQLIHASDLQMRLGSNNNAARVNTKPLEIAVWRSTYPPPSSLKTLGQGLDAISHARTVERSNLRRFLADDVPRQEMWWANMKARFSLAIQAWMAVPELQWNMTPQQRDQAYMMFQGYAASDSVLAMDDVSDPMHAITRGLHRGALINGRLRPFVERMLSDDIVGPVFNMYEPVVRADQMRENLAGVDRFIRHLLMNRGNVAAQTNALKNGIRASYLARPRWTPEYI